jgi:hypothetical protein
MVESVTLDDLGVFLNVLVRGFDDYIFFAFVLMAVFNIMIFMKYLVSGYR